MYINIFNIVTAIAFSFLEIPSRDVKTFSLRSDSSLSKNTLTRLALKRCRFHDSLDISEVFMRQ
jgi:hypothetical protein